MNKMMALLLFTFCLTVTQQVDAQDESPGNQSSVADSAETPTTQTPPTQVLKQLVGKWEGTCRTWFEPGKLADESEISGEFVRVLNGPFIRHRYEGSIRGKPREGEEMIALNGVSKSFQVSWIDSFHMNYAMMFAQGKQRGNSFTVTGEYDVGADMPRWKWRTEYEFVDDDHLTITAFNIHPKGMEAKAVETKYKRVK